ncbi:hypothetical protein OSTOST_00504 [Ostertagia ostertagi]
MDSNRANSTEIKVLGIHRNAIGDTITLQCSKKQVNKISRRTVLSQINGYCYDPLGLLSPDDTRQDIPPGSSQAKESVEKDGTTQHTLSIFVDSSKRAYACCIYVTTTSRAGIKETKLLTAKSKIAPIKKEQAIPRLGLLAIFIGLSLAESTINSR